RTSCSGTRIGIHANHLECGGRRGASAVSEGETRHLAEAFVKLSLGRARRLFDEAEHDRRGQVLVVVDELAVREVLGQERTHRRYPDALAVLRVRRIAG